MQDTDRTLYVLCGIPYSGKSTFADKDPVLSGLPKLSSDRLILEKAERLGLHIIGCYCIHPIGMACGQVYR